MEINVNSIVQETNENELQFFASVMELGYNAGRETWNNAKQFASSLTMNRDQRLQLVDYFADFGAWSRFELLRMATNDGEEIKALFIQHVSGDARTLSDALEELEASMEDFTEEQFREATENQRGNLYKGDCGNWFFDISH